MSHRLRSRDIAADGGVAEPATSRSGSPARRSRAARSAAARAKSAASRAVSTGGCRTGCCGAAGCSAFRRAASMRFSSAVRASPRPVAPSGVRGDRDGVVFCCSRCCWCTEETERSVFCWKMRRRLLSPDTSISLPAAELHTICSVAGHSELFD